MATARQIATQVLALAQHLSEEPEGLFIPDIAKHIPTTIREMVIDIAMMGKQDDRHLLTKTITPAIVTVADDFDTVDLTTDLTSSEPILLDLPFPGVTHATSQSGELLRVADFRNLKFVSTSEGMDWYSIQGATLYINASPELTGNLTIQAFYVPLVTNLRKQFEPELINRLLMKIGIARQ